MKHILLIALLPLLLASCATDMTPEQAQQWAGVGHTVLRNSLQDAKDFEAVTR